ncbi:MAG: DUF262 domain-containing protein [Zoogloeaceae bacterium]|jgi:hypothetical protein|nr:DUF262 domain-containing protein [Zoogloeaceae bacterium]
MSTFRTNPVALSELLKNCRDGALQLPDFQRSWVWDEERIKSLIASVSRAFPVGALMTLEAGGEANFKPRPMEGAAPCPEQLPRALLLDGQQRVTSMYQVTLRGQVVETKTAKGKNVRRWFYIDIRKALDASVDRDEAIVGLPEDLKARRDFGREIVLDVSSSDLEYEKLMYPVRAVFDWDDWQEGFQDFWRKKPEEDEMRDLFKRFKKEVLENFKTYHVPVIELNRETSKEAVCVVFEKVNTGGKPLDAFELVTAMYAAEGHELRKDWYGDGKTHGRQQHFKEFLKAPGSGSGILSGVGNTDFLQVISLFHTRQRRREAEKAGKQGKELPNVTGNRQALLSLPLAAYKQYERQVEDGFERAARFLYTLRIYRLDDLPYQSQIVPLAAILADIGNAWGNQLCRDKLQRWFWNGVFGELYGSAVDSRNALDFMEVPIWLQAENGAEPSTVSETMFRADRLKTMRSRLSAAYKGMNALLMGKGARDFCSGQAFDDTVFFGENVDIHHVFPKKWCIERHISPEVFDSIINKTPLSWRTNRIIGGDAPSVYLKKLEEEERIARASLDENLCSHQILPDLLRTDRFEDFLADRQRRLLDLIRGAGVRVADADSFLDDDAEAAEDEDSIEASQTIA